MGKLAEVLGGALGFIVGAVGFVIMTVFPFWLFWVLFIN